MDREVKQTDACEGSQPYVNGDVLRMKMRMIEEKVIRNVFEVAVMHESDHKAYWRDRSYIERIETIEC